MWTRIGRLGLLFLGWSMFVIQCWAEVQVDARVDKKEVCTGSSFVYSITMSGDVKDYDLPDKISIPGARVYGRGSSQQITVRNGRITNTIQLNFVVMPLRAGELTIPSLRIKVNGRDYFTPTQKVLVKDCGAARKPVRRPYSVGAPVQGRVVQAEGQEDTFAVISLSKDTVYLGEPLVLTYTIYTRSRVAYKGFAQKPYFEGFVQEEVPPSEDMNRREVIIGGRRYVAVDVMRFVLVPTRTGRLVVNPGSLLMARTSRMRDVFKDFFSDSFWDSFFDEDFFTTEEQFEIRLSPREVQVLPLPQEGRPKQFSGLVGDFSLSVKVDRDEVKVGESLTLTVEVKGTGPLSVLDSLPIKIEHARVYKSSSSSFMELVNGRPIYRKTFEYIVVPDEPGRLEIPSLSINFFSPSEKKYKEVRYPGTEIKVLPNEGVSPSSGFFPSPDQGTSPSPGTGVKKVGEDIRFIKEDLKIEDTRFWYRFWGLNLLALLVFLVVLFKEKILAIGLGVSRKGKEKAELERLISKCELELDDGILRQVLDRVLKLAAKKAPGKADSFQHLSEEVPELKEVATISDAFLFGGLSLPESDKRKILGAIKKAVKNLLVLVVFFLLSVSPSFAQNGAPEVGFGAGNSLYRAGDYEGAIREYEQLVSQGIRSFQLFYNLGNAYYKAGQPEKALLYYLKAWRINPLDKDLNYNIRLVRRQLGLADTSEGMERIPMLPPKTIAGMMAIVFWLMLFMSLLKAEPIRKFTILLLGGIAFVVLGVWLVVSISYFSSDLYLAMKKTTLYSGPSEKDSQLAVLNPGVELKGVKRLGDWIQVKTSNGVVGWVKASSLEKI